MKLGTFAYNVHVRIAVLARLLSIDIPHVANSIFSTLPAELTPSARVIISH